MNIFFPKRNPASHKGSYGKCLIIAGAEGMAGAAYFSALSAYRSGTGLVKLCSAKENCGILQTLVPEAIILSSPKKKEHFQELEKAIEWADFLLFGPGMGTGKEAEELLRLILEKGKTPLLIDADGLNLLSGDSALQALAKAYGRKTLLFLTPHLMEFSRLSGRSLTEIENRRGEIAKSFGKEYHCILLLKSHDTMVISPDGELVYQRKKSCAALSKGGSGDVFAGSLAGIYLILEEESKRKEKADLFPETMLLKNSDEEKEDRSVKQMWQGCKAAILSCEAQILAGELAAKEWGEHGVLAENIANAMGKALELLVEQGCSIDLSENREDICQRVNHGI